MHFALQAAICDVDSVGVGVGDGVGDGVGAGVGVGDGVGDGVGLGDGAAFFFLFVHFFFLKNLRTLRLIFPLRFLP